MTQHPTVSYTPINNPKPITKLQQEALLKFIEDEKLHGTADGLLALTREEANKLIIELKADRK